MFGREKRKSRVCSSRVLIAQPHRSFFTRTTVSRLKLRQSLFFEPGKAAGLHARPSRFLKIYEEKNILSEGKKYPAARDEAHPRALTTSTCASLRGDPTSDMLRAPQLKRPSPSGRAVFFFLFCSCSVHNWWSSRAFSTVALSRVEKILALEKILAVPPPSGHSGAQGESNCQRDFPSLSRRKKTILGD